MSALLLDIATRFVENAVSAAEFSDAFIKGWKRERDDGALLRDSPDLSEALSSIFCLAELYNPDSNREDYELDELQLRAEVRRLLPM